MEIATTDTIDSYDDLLTTLKERIRKAQVNAAFAVNRELMRLYWSVGSALLEQEAKRGWGAKVVTKLADDLKRAFPDMKGFSVRNLRYMRTFAESYSEQMVLKNAVALLSWYHITTLLDKVKAHDEREWYIAQTVTNGWTRDVMVPLDPKPNCTIDTNCIIE